MSCTMCQSCFTTFRAKARVGAFRLYWLSYVASRIGLLASNIVQWQPPDDSMLASGFVLDTVVNIFILLIRACKKNMLLHTVIV